MKRSPPPPFVRDSPLLTLLGSNFDPWFARIFRLRDCLCVLEEASIAILATKWVKPDQPHQFFPELQCSAVRGVTPQRAPAAEDFLIHHTEPDDLQGLLPDR